MANNPAERALHAPIVGRKLSFGAFSEPGAKLRGCLWSVLGTLALAGICPWRWTQAYLQRCAKLGGTPAARRWLPWGVGPTRREALAAPGQPPGPTRERARPGCRKPDGTPRDRFIGWDSATRQRNLPLT